MRTLILMTLSLIVLPVPVAASVDQLLTLETQIAYQQGQFGALYAQCGSEQDRMVIGGSLVRWKTETFRDYHGSSSELQTIQRAFDDATADVVKDNDSCRDWLQQAQVTWHSILILATPRKIM